MLLRKKCTPSKGSISNISIANISDEGDFFLTYCDQPPGAEPRSKMFCFFFKTLVF